MLKPDNTTSVSDSRKTLSTNDWHQICTALLPNESQLRNEGLPAGWHKIASSEQARVYFSEELQVFAKFFFEAKLKNRLRDTLLPSQSRYQRFCRRTQNLHALEFPAPDILYQNKIDGVGCVITAAFPGMGVGSLFAQYLTLEKLASLPIDRAQALRWKRQVASELGALIARLHNAGIAHGDLRPNNVLVNCLANQPRFCLIDNERNKHYVLAITRRATIKNLVQLNMIWPADVGASYRWRFLKSYLSVRTNSLNGKSLARNVHRLTQRRLRDKEKDGYRKVAGFQPFAPDLAQLLQEWES